MSGESEIDWSKDHSSEIEMELDQLIVLGELLRKMPTPAEMREEFFPGLADMIAGGADRIREMLKSTYDFVGERTEELARKREFAGRQEVA